MYLPAHFNEQRVEVLHQLICERPLGALVTLNAGGLNANHIPFEIETDPAPLGTLRCHVARANPIWRDFSPGVEALVIFQGAKAYVSPSFYPSKQVTGEVVPTYNYVIVHAYGAIKVIHDREWLRGLVTRLTNRFEAGRAAPWQVTDAPAAFIDKQLAAIVGIEIALTRLIGKWKVSQNRPDMDRKGVVEGLNERGDEDSSDIAR
jgi:transcriptional regulator